jgi:hypothetical protein
MMRRLMFDRFLAFAQPASDESVLDVGVTSDRSYESSNYLEAWYPNKHQLTAFGLDERCVNGAPLTRIRSVLRARVDKRWQLCRVDSAIARGSCPVAL